MTLSMPVCMPSRTVAAFLDLTSAMRAGIGPFVAVIDALGPPLAQDADHAADHDLAIIHEGILDQGAGEHPFLKGRRIDKRDEGRCRAGGRRRRARLNWLWLKSRPPARARMPPSSLSSTTTEPWRYSGGGWVLLVLIRAVLAKDGGVFGPGLMIVAGMPLGRRPGGRAGIARRVFWRSGSMVV